MSRLRALAVNLGLMVASLALLALASEGLARLLEARRIRADERAARESPMVRYDPVLGWTKVPGSVRHIRRPEIDVEIRINSLGLRGPERGYERPAGVRRVLLLGDSFTEGYYANDADTVRGVLEERLNARGCGRWEAINGGTISYSTDHEYVFYKTEGRRYGAEQVILLFYYNDLYFNLSPTGPHGEFKPFFVVENGALVQRDAPHPTTEEVSRRPPPRAERRQPWRGSLALRLLSDRTVDSNPPLHRLLAALGLLPPVAAEPPREFAPFGPRPGSNAAWKVTGALLAALKREVESDGAHLTVLYIPARFEVNDASWALTRARFKLGRRWDRARAFERLAEVCAPAGIALVDPREALRRAETNGPAAYLTRDEHWTPTGNHVAAEVLDGALAPRLGCGGR